MMNLPAFFATLYTTADKDASLYLWTIPNKRTQVFSRTNMMDMANEALRLSAAGQNVYFGVGTCRSDLGQYERPTTNDVVSITALWCDIDIADGSAHAAKNLPPDIAAAKALLPEALPPSITVNSGHGLHAYWLLREQWLLGAAGSEERAAAIDVLQRVQGYIRAQAAARGWKVDATADLPRVLRCPDTNNYKDPTNPVLCRIIDETPALYNPSDFDLLPPVEVSAPTSERKERFTRRDTDGEADMMLNNCEFLRYCTLKPDSISYGEWMTALTNIVRASDGIEAAHRFSALDKSRYNKSNTDSKINEALNRMNPQGCAYIRKELGFKGCPAGGCGVKAPCGWSLGRLPRARAIVRGIGNVTAETVYTPDVIGALTELKIHDKAEYGRFMETAKGRIDVRRLEAAVRQELGKATPPGPQEPPAADEAEAEAPQTALSEGQRLGDVTTKKSIPDTPLDLNVPANFAYSENGVYYQTQTRDGVPRYMRACGTPIIITRRFYNMDTMMEKVELSFKYFGGWRRTVQPKNLIYVARSITALANYGVNVTSESSKYLVRYLSELENANPRMIPLVPAVSRLGWRTENGETRFLTPTDTGYYFDMDDSGELTNAFTVRGDFAAWLAKSREVRAYPAARFMLAASLATPLLKLFNHRNFMIYCWGTSGGGKTAAMTWALSVWGVASELMVNFNMSIAGLEGRLALTNDLPAGINERQAAGGGRDKQEWLERIVYMVEGGRGKARATTTGIRKTLSWRTIGLACGEEPLSSEESVQGVKTRLLEFNCFPLLPNDLAKSLYSTAEQHCGHAGRFYTDRLTAELKAGGAVIYDAYTAIQAELTAAYPEYFSVHIDAVSLVCLADFLASQWLFQESADQARAEARDLANWVMDQLPNHEQISDTERSWDFLKSWILSNAEHFDDFGGTYRKANISPKYGVEEDGYLYIYPSMLSSALNEEGFPAQKLLHEWGDSGRIESEFDGTRRHFKVQKRIDGMKARFIKIAKAKLNA